MKRGIIVTALVGLMVTATTAQAANYHRHSHVNRHHHRVNPSYRVQPYYGRRGYYPPRINRQYFYNGYPRNSCSNYGRVYQPYYNSYGQFGIYGPNYSLRFGF